MSVDCVRHQQTRPPRVTLPELNRGAFDKKLNRIVLSELGEWGGFADGPASYSIVQVIDDRSARQSHSRSGDCGVELSMAR